MWPALTPPTCIHVHVPSVTVHRVSHKPADHLYWRKGESMTIHLQHKMYIHV